MSLRRRLNALFRPRQHTAASIAARLDRIEARMDLFGHGGQAVYVGNNRVLAKIIVGGHTFAFLLEADDRLITPWLVVAGAFETPVTDFFLGEIRADSHCLDVGANFGYFACLMARLAPQGRVIAVEADQHVFELTRDNLAVNGGLLNGAALHLAASDHEGEMTLYRRKTRSGNTSIVNMGDAFTTQMGEAPAESFTVAMASVDSLLDRMDGRVDYMKVDVEGAEPLVLRGAGRTIAANPQIKIVMEWSPGQIQAAGFDLRAFYADIEAMGLRVYDLEGGRQVPLSVDQLLDIPYRPGLILRR